MGSIGPVSNSVRDCNLSKELTILTSEHTPSEVLASTSTSQPTTNGTVLKSLPHASPAPCFWQSEPHPLHNHRSTEQLPEHSDIVIIGAGYAGVSTAYHLSKDPVAAGKSITILEARGACSGATGRNGGHLRPDLYGHIPTYVDRAGAEAAAEIAEFEIAHVQEIKKIVEEENIDCDFTLTRTIDTWCNEEAAKKAKIQYDRLKAKNLKHLDDVIFYTGKNVEGICGVKGSLACSSYTAGTIWPYKFIMHLVSTLVTSSRINLQTNTPATSLSPSGSGYKITTSRGHIHATQVIHANNAYVSTLLPEYASSIIPCKGICCRITCPLGTVAPLLNDSYINRTADNTLSYLIPRADGSIIVGGASSKFRPHLDQWYGNVDDSVLIDSAKDYYDNYMQTTYRGWESSSAKVDNIWTGVMGYSYDSNPHVGAVPGREGQFVVAGWNGHGMPCIWLSAKGVAKMVAQDLSFEDTGLPRMYKTTKFRLERAAKGKEEDGDILNGAGILPYVAG
ncbi:FAD dependent oxidoreductase-domain-containing protein [Tricladium varicosporioides]|nr:FAD dependent oxidoreductase-domain-containing protein [Hymenoscyphus varicosporioides]